MPSYNFSTRIKVQRAEVRPGVDFYYNQYNAPNRELIDYELDPYNGTISPTSFGLLAEGSPVTAVYDYQSERTSSPPIIEIANKDNKYRNRIKKFIDGVNIGPSQTGLQTAARAIIQDSSNILETYKALLDVDWSSGTAELLEKPASFQGVLYDSSNFNSNTDISYCDIEVTGEFTYNDTTIRNILPNTLGILPGQCLKVKDNSDLFSYLNPSHTVPRVLSVASNEITIDWPPKSEGPYTIQFNMTEWVFSSDDYVYSLYPDTIETVTGTITAGNNVIIVNDTTSLYESQYITGQGIPSFTQIIYVDDENSQIYVDKIPTISGNFILEFSYVGNQFVAMCWPGDSLYSLQYDYIRVLFENNWLVDGKSGFVNYHYLSGNPCLSGSYIDPNTGETIITHPMTDQSFNWIPYKNNPMLVQPVSAKDSIFISVPSYYYNGIIIEFAQQSQQLQSEIQLKQIAAVNRAQELGDVGKFTFIVQPRRQLYGAEVSALADTITDLKPSHCNFDIRLDGLFTEEAAEVDSVTASSSYIEYKTSATKITEITDFSSQLKTHYLDRIPCLSAEAAASTYWEQEGYTSKQEFETVIESGHHHGPNTVTSFSDSSNTVWYGWDKPLFSYYPHYACDGDPNSFWLSVGNDNPTSPWAFEWLEVNCTGEEINKIALTPHFGGMTAYICVETDLGWQGSQTLKGIYGGSAAYPNGADQVPYVKVVQLPGALNTKTEIDLGVHYKAQKVRVIFHNLANSGIVSAAHPYPYRAALSNILVFGEWDYSISSTKEVAAGKAPTYVQVTKKTVNNLIDDPYHKKSDTSWISEAKNTTKGQVYAKVFFDSWHKWNEFVINIPPSMVGAKAWIKNSAATFNYWAGVLTSTTSKINFEPGGKERIWNDSNTYDDKGLILVIETRNKVDLVEPGISSWSWSIDKGTPDNGSVNWNLSYENVNKFSKEKPFRIDIPDQYNEQGWYDPSHPTVKFYHWRMGQAFRLSNAIPINKAYDYTSSFEVFRAIDRSCNVGYKDKDYFDPDKTFLDLIFLDSKQKYIGEYRIVTEITEANGWYNFTNVFSKTNFPTACVYVQLRFGWWCQRAQAFLLSDVSFKANYTAQYNAVVNEITPYYRYFKYEHPVTLTHDNIYSGDDSKAWYAEKQPSSDSRNWVTYKLEEPGNPDAVPLINQVTLYSYYPEHNYVIKAQKPYMEYTQNIVVKNGSYSQLDYTNIKHYSEIVLSLIPDTSESAADAPILYEKDIDYTIDYDNGRIQRLVGGKISPSDEDVELTITYLYSFTDLVSYDASSSDVYQRAGWVTLNTAVRTFNNVTTINFPTIYTNQIRIEITNLSYQDTGELDVVPYGWKTLYLNKGYYSGIYEITAAYVETIKNWQPEEAIDKNSLTYWYSLGKSSASHVYTGLAANSLMDPNNPSALSVISLSPQEWYQIKLKNLEGGVAPVINELMLIPFTCDCVYKLKTSLTGLDNDWQEIKINETDLYYDFNTGLPVSNTVSFIKLEPGTITFDRIKARYIKLEFYNLELNSSTQLYHVGLRELSPYKMITMGEDIPYKIEAFLNTDNIEEITYGIEDLVWRDNTIDAIVTPLKNFNYLSTKICIG